MLGVAQVGASVVTNIIGTHKSEVCLSIYKLCACQNVYVCVQILCTSTAKMA